MKVIEVIRRIGEDDYDYDYDDNDNDNDNEKRMREEANIE